MSVHGNEGSPVAPSLSTYVGTKQPSGAAGEILQELFDFYDNKV